MKGSARPSPLRLVSRREDDDRPAQSTSVDDQGRFRDRLLPHLDAAYSYARYLSRDPVGAEDIVQDAFLRAYRAIATCHSNEKAWLLSIVRNCFYDWANANKRSQSAAEVGPGVDNETPEIIAQQKQTAAALRETIGALPEPFREALVLRELEELTYREIADLTRSPIGTVMSRLARARHMLATVLISRDGNGEPGQ